MTTARQGGRRIEKVTMKQVMQYLTWGEEKNDGKLILKSNGKEAPKRKDIEESCSFAIWHLQKQK